MAFYPQFYHKTDREGRPIYIEQLGKLDTSKLAALTNQDRQLHHLVDEYEKFLGSRLPATSKVTGGLVETSCTILDLTNAGISTFYKGESESKLRMSSDREREGNGDRWAEACPASSQEIRQGTDRSQRVNHPLSISRSIIFARNLLQCKANNQSRITFPPHPVSVRTTVSFHSPLFKG
jgi:hypothetical protein